jgi:hypothetical protein
MFRKLAATDAMAVSLNFPKRKIPAGYGTRRNNMTTRKSAVLIAALLCSVALAPGAVAEDSLGEPGREVGKPNPLKNVYFGEQHMHTRNSFDAFTIGVGQTWDQAYRFAKGEKVKLSTTGDEM